MKQVRSHPHVHGIISTKDLSAKTWPTFEELFRTNKGVWGGCWCMFYHIPGTFNERDYDSNRNAKRALVSKGKAHGTIVSCGDAPVGWCQFGPRKELPRIDRKLLYKPVAENSWRVTCLFVDRTHRGMGIGREAIKGAVASMKRRRVKTIEAYPVEGKLSSSLLWSGTPELFEEAGFRRVGPLGKSSWIYSLRLR